MTEAQARMVRPFGVSLVAVLVWVQSTFMILSGLGFLLDKSDADLGSYLDAGETSLQTMGIGLVVVGAVAALVGLGLWVGNDLAKWVVAVIAASNVAGGLYVAFAYEGVWRWQGIFSALWGCLVLFLLLNRDAGRFFEAN